MSLLPKEHGAYGQIAFPLVTAFIVAGLSVGGLLVAAAVTSGFLAHEPAAVLLGLRGPRARRARRAEAIRWLAACAASGVTAGAGALLALPDAARWSMLVPLLPALALATATARGREKSGTAEAAAALAFSGAALPVSLATGAPLQAGLAVVIPFALLFVTTTLAVRVVILRVRGGGDMRAAAAARLATVLLVGLAAAALAALTMTDMLPAGVLLGAAPGLVTATVVTVTPPPPARLRTIGWTLIAVSVLTAGIVVGTA